MLELSNLENAQLIPEPSKHQCTSRCESVRTVQQAFKVRIKKRRDSCFIAHKV